MDKILGKIYSDKYTEERICEWDFLEIENTLIRIYFKPEKEIGLGFVFYAVEVTTYQDDSNIWNPDHSEISLIYEGIAYFDGVRHMYMGDRRPEEAGYINYPSLKNHIDVLSKVIELEKKYCRDYNE